MSSHSVPKYPDPSPSDWSYVFLVNGGTKWSWCLHTVSPNIPTPPLVTGPLYSSSMEAPSGPDVFTQCPQISPPPPEAADGRTLCWIITAYESNKQARTVPHPLSFLSAYKYCTSPLLFLWFTLHKSDKNVFFFLGQISRTASKTLQIHSFSLTHSHWLWFVEFYSFRTFILADWDMPHPNHYNGKKYLCNVCDFWIWFVSFTKHTLILW